MKDFIPVKGSPTDLELECAKCGSTQLQRVVIHEEVTVSCDDCIVGFYEGDGFDNDPEQPQLVMESAKYRMADTKFQYCPICGRKL